jgi:hypothetical protein
VGYYAIKVHYFDASALVKLVANDPDEEPGRSVLRKYTPNMLIPGTRLLSVSQKLLEL